MIHFLLLQMTPGGGRGLPGFGNKIPGVPFEYIPEQGAMQAIDLYYKMVGTAWWLMFGLMIVGGFYVVIAVADRKNIEATEIIKRGVAAAVMMGLLPILFALIMSAGGAIGERIFSGADMQTLNKAFRQAAQEEMNEKETTNPGAMWLRRMASLTSILNPGQILLTELFRGIATVAFYASAILMTLFWRFLVVILFVMGPILCVLGVIPQFGPKVIGGYFAALCQVSAWQIWFAVCAFFVKSGNAFFQAQRDLFTKVDAVNDYESIAICLMFAIAYLMTPFLVNALLPISKFSAMGTWAMQSGMKAVMGAASGVMQMAGGKVVGAVGAFSRFGGKGK